MLWPIELPDRHSGDPLIADELPSPNFGFLKRVAMGDSRAVIVEAGNLEDELGLSGRLDELPELDELFERLVAIRPDWDWKEEIRPDACSDSCPLSEMTEQGIFNRAIIIPGKRSPYTRGLESELKTLAHIDESKLPSTALGHWLSGQFDSMPRSNDEPLIEVLPMNTEQRAAVTSALSSGHTVVTGPPGTGKSQVVTNILMNAAWRGMSVLFASKNNKAVDVVETRVNGIGSRPVLLRKGSLKYATKAGEFFAATINGSPTQEDENAYQEALSNHQEFLKQQMALETAQEETLKARNEVDRLERATEPFRQIFGNDRFIALNDADIAENERKFELLGPCIDSIDRTKHGLLGKIVLAFRRTHRISELRSCAVSCVPSTEKLSLKAPEVEDAPELASLRLWHEAYAKRIDAAKQVVSYKKALDLLASVKSLEELAQESARLSKEIAQNSLTLWQNWVELTPKRLRPEDRNLLAKYSALHELAVAAGGGTINQSVAQEMSRLEQKLSKLFHCWAVSSLSAKGKIPLVPGHFDLVVIDEASQCDIASAIPLLYRAKRAVIIGDDKQLRHISALTPVKDSELLAKHGLVATRSAWLYSVRSLYDLAVGLMGTPIHLRDHHRSHADIIRFSDEKFYEGELRVVTPYSRLRFPSERETGIHWRDIRGATRQEQGRSALNVPEAEAIVRLVHDLIVTRRYCGTIGVVTPFSAQRELLKKMILAMPDLANAQSRCDLLVDTIHGFQGDERDVIFFSPVISEGASESQLGFLRKNGNLFNVAITRARAFLQVVGDRSSALASGVEYYEKFANYVGGLKASPENPEPDQQTDLGSEYPRVDDPDSVSDWERIFYRALYDAGIRPIPQFKVEQYRLDFAVFSGERRLNIEIDGERYHKDWSGELCLRDRLRNQRLIELGWEVKRFWVYEIRDRLPECIEWVNNWIGIDLENNRESRVRFDAGVS